MILCYGNPSDPGQLWENHKESLTADILYKERNRLNDKNLQLNNEMINISLYYLNKILDQQQKSLINFPGLPTLPKEFNPNNDVANFEKNRFIREHQAYNKEALKLFTQECEAKFNKDQLDIYNQNIKSKKINYSGNMYFLDGPGGQLIFF